MQTWNMQQPYQTTRPFLVHFHYFLAVVVIQIKVAVYRSISLSSMDSTLSPPGHWALAHLYHLNSLGSIQPGFAYRCTELINVQCLHCPHWYHCVFLWYEEAVGWHMSDLPKALTMTDSARIRTHDQLCHSGPLNTSRPLYSKFLTNKSHSPCYFKTDFLTLNIIAIPLFNHTHMV